MKKGTPVDILGVSVNRLISVLLPSGGKIIELPNNNNCNQASKKKKVLPLSLQLNLVLQTFHCLSSALPKLLSHWVKTKNKGKKRV